MLAFRVEGTTFKTKIVLVVSKDCQLYTVHNILCMANHHQSSEFHYLKDVCQPHATEK